MKYQNVKVIAKPKLGKTNNRNRILYSLLEEIGLEIDELQLSKVIFSNYDIFHMHWPDRILNSRIFIIKIIFLNFFFYFMWLKKIKIVYTVHNPCPKKYFRIWHKKAYYATLNFWVDAFIFPSLYAKEIWKKENPKNSELRRPDKIIPLGLQDEIVSQGSCMPDELGSYDSDEKFLLFVGRITSDKKFPEAVLDLLHDLRFVDYKILLAGAPKDKFTVETLEDIQKRNQERFLLVSRYLSDTEINWLIENCAAVIINYNAVNSGVATLALAHDANVIVYNDELKVSLEITYGLSNIYTLGEFNDLNDEPKSDGKRTVYCSKERPTMRNISWHTAEFYQELLKHGRD